MSRGIKNNSENGELLELVRNSDPGSYKSRIQSLGDRHGIGLTYTDVKAVIN